MIKINVPTKLPSHIELWKNEADEITQKIIKAPTLSEKQALIDKHQDHW
jgi:hypothetical protein